MRARWVCGAAVAVALGGCGEPPRGAVQIERAAPDYGPLGGGTRIELTGAGFRSDDAVPNRVLIAGREAPLAGAVDDTTLELVIPPGELPGDAEIVVLNGNGNATATGIFRYSTPPTISSIAPANVVFSSTSTVVSVTGHGFLEEGAGVVTVLVDGRLASDVVVTGDDALTFTAPPGPALVRPVIEVIDDRGTATTQRGFRYAPGPRGGLLLFPAWSPLFAVFFDPVDASIVAIPLVGPTQLHMTAVARDDRGDYWGLDRSRLFGRIDITTQTLEHPVQAAGWFPTMVRAGDHYVALERGSRRFGRLDPVTGAFTPIGAGTIPCCGSFGLAYDGTTIHFTGRDGAALRINTIDGATGAQGPGVTVTAGPGFHIEEMRFFHGTLYATSRDGTLVSIDPTTGATTVLPVNLGRFNAMEVFE